MPDTTFVFATWISLSTAACHLQRKRENAHARDKERVCVRVCCSVLQCVAACHSVLHLTFHCSVVCVAVCCSVLQCIAVCHSVLHLTATHDFSLSTAACHLPRKRESAHAHDRERVCVKESV